MSRSGSGFTSVPRGARKNFASFGGRVQCRIALVVIEFICPSRQHVYGFVVIKVGYDTPTSSCCFL